MPQGPGTYDKPGRPKKKATKMKKVIRKLKKRKKKKGRNGDIYGQVPISGLHGETENPVGGN